MANIETVTPEQILIGILGLIILYVGFRWFSSSKQNDDSSESNADRLQQFITSGKVPGVIFMIFGVILFAAALAYDEAKLPQVAESMPDSKKPEHIEKVDNVAVLQKSSPPPPGYQRDTLHQSPAVGVTIESTATQAKEEALARGESVYNKHCAACHGKDGKGIPGVFPAIQGGKIAVGSMAGHIDIVLNGKPGTAMQGYRGYLTDNEIADVITFERNAFGNNMGEVLLPSQLPKPQSRSSSVKRSISTPAYRTYDPSANLHVIGVYEGRKADTDKPWWAKCEDINKMGECHSKYAGKRDVKEINILLHTKDKPVILALMAYNPIRWVISNPNGGVIDGVILAGYHGQKVSGISSEVPVTVFTHGESDCGLCQYGDGYFYAYERNSPEFETATKRLGAITGKHVKTFQGRYSSGQFTIIDE